GLLAIAVPDCEPYITYGDISMLFHEHWSYFRNITLVSTLQIAGYNSIEVEKAGFGGLLYAKCIPGEKNHPFDYLQQLARDDRGATKKFIERSQNNLQKLRNYLADADLCHETVGIYCPGRALNALGMIKSRGDIKFNLRFFDDNHLLHGQYFPGFPQIIESREALYREPVDRILVMSWTFGMQLAEVLKDNIGSSVCIETCEELFSIQEEIV
ncbi:MAG: hypothetical protein ACE5HI_13155, partial [bacterium]